MNKILILLMVMSLWTSEASAELCRLVWDLDSTGVTTGYRVYHSLQENVYYEPALASLELVNSITCEELGLWEDGNLHYFVVTAFNQWGESGPSNQVSIWLLPTLPPPPEPPVCLRWLKNGKCWKWSN